MGWPQQLEANVDDSAWDQRIDSMRLQEGLYWALQVQEGSIEMYCIVPVWWWTMWYWTRQVTSTLLTNNIIVYIFMKLAITIDENEINSLFKF